MFFILAASFKKVFLHTLWIVLHKLHPISKWQTPLFVASKVAKYNALSKEVSLGNTLR